MFSGLRWEPARSLRGRLRISPSVRLRERRRSSSPPPSQHLSMAGLESGGDGGKAFPPRHVRRVCSGIFTPVGSADVRQSRELCWEIRQAFIRSFRLDNRKCRGVAIHRGCCFQLGSPLGLSPCGNSLMMFGQRIQSQGDERTRREVLPERRPEERPAEELDRAKHRERVIFQNRR